jgi:Flp pilus assembly protein TadG
MTRLANPAPARTVPAMPAKSLLRSRHTGSRRRSRGTQLLEFAIALPLFLFILMFSLDLGRLVFTSGLVHDAAFTSARAGAQLGAAGDGSSGASRRAFDEVISNYGWDENDAAFAVETGRTCTKAINSDDNFVTVRADYKMNFLTPGLYEAVGMVSDSLTKDGHFMIEAVGIARCEITRD